MAEHKESRATHILTARKYTNLFCVQMKKMVLDGKISNYSMYSTASNNANATGNCPYPADTNGSGGGGGNYSSATSGTKAQSNSSANCNVQHYCQNPKFDHMANHWSESMVAMHQQAQQETTNYFRDQWYFNDAAANSYHVNDTTIQNLSATQLTQNQHCLIFPHTHFSHPPPQSTGKCQFDIFPKQRKRKKEPNESKAESFRFK